MKSTPKMPFRAHIGDNELVLLAAVGSGHPVIAGVPFIVGAELGGVLLIVGIAGAFVVEATSIIEV